MEHSKIPFVIGCDGGGSGCRVIVSDLAGRILARSEGGPANVTSDFDLALRSVSLALSDAAGQMGLPVAAFSDAQGHFGLAGVQSEALGARFAAALPCPKVCVTEDWVVAVAGALGDGDGVVIAIGTGTFIAASRAGRLLHLGGWGLNLSDQASGAWLGRGLLSRVLSCHDGLEGFSDLTHEVFAEFNNDPRDLVAFAAKAKPADYARFAPAVVRAAQAGDVAGLSLMLLGADYLARGLVAAGFVPGETLCLTGGVAPHYSPYLPAVARAAIAAPRGSSLDGALALAHNATRILP